MQQQTTRHIIVWGKVQGVFFRKFAKEKADALGLAGWVQNTNDGKVEIMVQGDEAGIAAFLQWCHEGSPLSAVSGVEVTEVQLQPLRPPFIIRR